MYTLGTQISLVGKPRTQLTPNLILRIPIQLFKLRPINRVYHRIAYLYVYSSVSDPPTTIPTYRLYFRYLPVTSIRNKVLPLKTSGFRNYGRLERPLYLVYIEHILGTQLLYLSLERSLQEGVEVLPILRQYYKTANYYPIISILISYYSRLCLCYQLLTYNSRSSSSISLILSTISISRITPSS